MAEKLGLNAKLYYAVGGQGGAFNELTNAKDVTVSLEKTTADVTTRASGGWRAKKAALKEAKIEWEMVWDTADAGFTAIKNAYFNDEKIGLRALDEAGGQGLQADFEITNFTRNEPLEEALTVSVTAEITRSETPPQWVS